MDIHLLATLRELRDRGSVTAVAAALHLSPSAVSQQLATLQRSTPVPLTRKQGRTLVLTDAGRRLADAGQVVVEAMAQAEQVARGLTETDHDPVHVAAFHSAALAWFPALAADPRLDIRCHDHDVPADDFIALTGDVDVVVAQRAAHEKAWPAGQLTVIPLSTEPLDIALRVGHPAAGAELTPDVLTGLDWIAVHEDYPLATYLHLLAAHADRPLRVRHRINEFPTVVEMLAATDCAALLPRHTAPKDGSGIVLRALPGIRLVRHVDALVRTERLARPAVRETVARLQQLAARTHPRS